MATSVVKVNGTEVSVEDSGKTVVNINVCQESSLSYLAKAVAAAGQKWSRQNVSAPKTPVSSDPSPGRAQCNGEQKVLGGVQIVLGIVCLGLGGVLYLTNDFFRLKITGAPFWMGGLFMVSGSLCVVTERRRSCAWVLWATFFNLASVVAGCTGLAMGVTEMRYLANPSYWANEACKRNDGYQPWRPTWSPSPDWREEMCRERMRGLMNVYSGVQIVLVIISVAAIGIALFCFGYGLRVLCCSLRANSEDYVQIGDPEARPAEVPPPYEKSAKENTPA